MRGHPRPSAAIRGTQRSLSNVPQDAINGNQRRHSEKPFEWATDAINGNQLQSTAINGNQDALYERLATLERIPQDVVHTRDLAQLHSQIILIRAEAVGDH